MWDNIFRIHSRGTRNWQRKSYQIQIQASICRNNHLHLDYIFLYCCVLTPKKAVLSPEVPEGQKGTKKLCPSNVWGTTGGQN